MALSENRFANDLPERSIPEHHLHSPPLPADPWSQLSLRDLVESALSRSSYLAGKNLRFEVHADDVVLRGVVHSYYQKQLAQESLRSIAGVGRIQNEIEVLSGS